MNRIPMSAATTGLVRALITRAGVSRDRILLISARSTGWYSLTFAGERHQIELRVPGSDSQPVVKRMCAGLEEAEFSIPSVIVADISVSGRPKREADGSTSVSIEALTVGND